MYLIYWHLQSCAILPLSIQAGDSKFNLFIQPKPEADSCIITLWFIRVSTKTHVIISCLNRPFRRPLFIIYFELLRKLIDVKAAIFVQRTFIFKTFCLDIVMLCVSCFFLS